MAESYSDPKFVMPSVRGVRGQEDVEEGEDTGLGERPSLMGSDMLQVVKASSCKRLSSMSLAEGSGGELDSESGPKSELIKSSSASRSNEGDWSNGIDREENASTWTVSGTENADAWK